VLLAVLGGLQEETLAQVVKSLLGVHDHRLAWIDREIQPGEQFLEAL
jgi:hypothetical protein